jgi:hypothetical protein
MQMRRSGTAVLFLAFFSVLTGPASAAEALFPFEEPVTHLWGYRNERGTVVIQPQFSVAERFSDKGIAAVADGYSWKIINRKGKTIVQPYLVDNSPDPFRQGLARFRETGKVGFFDEHGKVVIPPQFAFALPFSEDRAAFCQGCLERPEGEHHVVEGGLWGFIDRKGRIVITPIYDKAESFQDRKARVMRNGHWIVIDRQGHWIDQ